MLESLKAEVYEANMELVRRGLVIYTFGNASGFARDERLLAIKPSGVPYDALTAAEIVVCDLDGNVVEGRMRPSSDLATHIAIYRAFPGVHGVAHTHSRHATAWAQARRDIPCFGTTHADYFRGPIPVTDPLTPEQIDGDYEWETGQAIVRRFQGMDPLQIPAVLVAGHAPFCWGRTPAAAAHNAVLTEEVARMAFETVTINPVAQSLSDEMRDKHFLRKHGPKASYGQR
jgi:L-ribulose-5-phosphate 4-epimerase